jgi:acyl carrier protein
VPSRDGTGQTRLSAYVVANESRRIEDGELRAFLATRLPDYMIPVSFTRLERWPLTAHGKLDQDALLRADDRNDVRSERDLSVIEARLLAICRDILGRTTLGVDERFLDAGFHSLGFAQLICRIQNDLGESLSFSEVFARRSVADLAALVEKRSGFGRAAREPLARADRSGDLPLSFSQERVWFLDKLHPGNIAYHSQSILRFHGRLDVSALERSLNLLVERHEILRTNFPERLGRPSQQINPYEPFKLAVEEALPLHAEQRVADVIRKPARCGVPECNGASSFLSGQEEDVLWQAFCMAAPARRRVFEPSSKRRKRAPAPLQRATT